MSSIRPGKEGLPRRRSLRLKGYDYSRAGAYFITLCAHERACLFGDVGARRAVPGTEQDITLNEFAAIVEVEWLKTASIHPHVSLGEFVIMPNHFHGILVFRHAAGTARRAPTERFGGPVAGSLATVVRSFKSAVTKGVNELRGTPGAPVWQRNYYEHVIRNEQKYASIAAYIADNPRRWAEDSLHPDFARVGG